MSLQPLENQRGYFQDLMAALDGSWTVTIRHGTLLSNYIAREVIMIGPLLYRKFIKIF
jgi:hypothetical protein